MPAPQGQRKGERGERKKCLEILKIKLEYEAIGELMWAEYETGNWEAVSTWPPFAAIGRGARALYKNFGIHQMSYINQANTGAMHVEQN